MDSNDPLWHAVLKVLDAIDLDNSRSGGLLSCETIRLASLLRHALWRDQRESLRRAPVPRIGQPERDNRHP